MESGFAPSENSPEGTEKSYYKVIESGFGGPGKELVSGEFESPEAAVQELFNQDPGVRVSYAVLDSEGNYVDVDDRKIDRMGGRG